MFFRSIFVLLAASWSASVSHGYIAVSAERLTLGEVLLEFPVTLVLTVEKADRTRGAYLFSITETLQGKPPLKPIRHSLLLDGKLPKRLELLKPGDTVISFMGSPVNHVLSYFAGGWYLSKPDQDWERLTQFRDDFNAMCSDSPANLAEVIRALTRGQNGILRVTPKGLAANSRVFIRYDATAPHRRFPALDPNRKGQQTFEQLLTATQDRDPAARQQALAAMVEQSEDPTKAVPILIKAMKDANAEVRIASAFGLCKLKGSASAVVPVLADSLKDKDRFVCAFAAQALALHGEQAKTALKELTDALRDRNYDHDYRPHRAAEAAEAILKIAPESPAAKDALRLLTSDKMLNDKRSDSEGTRTAAAKALGRCGLAAKPALPQLVARLTDELTGTRIAAAEAVLKIGGTGKERADAAKILFAEARKGELASRIMAIQAIGETRLAAFMDEVRTLSVDKEPAIRAAAKAAETQIAGK